MALDPFPLQSPVDPEPVVPGFLNDDDRIANSRPSRSLLANSRKTSKHAGKVARAHPMPRQPLPPPGTSEVISHFERLSSNDMKMAPICVWIAAAFSCESRDIGRLKNEWICNLSLPHAAGRYPPPMESSLRSQRGSTLMIWPS
jgi:hypothetical protein